MQFIMNSLSVNENGHLAMNGCDLVDIAKNFGTPAYVMDEETIRNNCRAYTSSIEKFYNGNGRAIYAGKALSCKYLYKLINDENMGIDAVSGGELYAAISAGFPTEKIYFHGSNKTPDEIEFAIKNNIGRMMVDNFLELERIDSVAKSLGKTVNIIIRITPGIDASTHEFIQTGKIDSKFGATLENGDAEKLTRFASTLDNVNLKGFHCHIGSQIFDLEPFEHAAEVMMNFIGDIREKYGIVTDELDLGGGFGIRYTENDTPVDLGEYMRAVSHVVKKIASERNLKLPFIIVEPGRSTVAEAGLTLYTVGTVKEIPGIRTYAAIDGGMTDNPRYILYQSEYTAVSAEKPNAPRNKTITLAGKCCESGDLIGKDMPLNDVKSGEILAVLCTGAYNYSMSSNYNRIPRPPIVMIKDGKAFEVVRRETYDDMLKCDLY